MGIQWFIAKTTPFGLGHGLRRAQDGSPDDPSVGGQSFLHEHNEQSERAACITGPSVARGNARFPRVFSTAHASPRARASHACSPHSRLVVTIACWSTTYTRRQSFSHREERNTAATDRKFAKA